MDNPSPAGEEVKKELCEDCKKHPASVTFADGAMDWIHGASLRICLCCYHGRVAKAVAETTNNLLKLQAELLEKGCGPEAASPPPSAPKCECTPWIRWASCPIHGRMAGQPQVAPPSARPAERRKGERRQPWQRKQHQQAPWGLKPSQYRSGRDRRKASSSLGEEKMTWFCANPACSFSTNIPSWPGDEFRPASTCPQCKGSHFKTFTSSASAPDAGQPQIRSVQPVNLHNRHAVGESVVELTNAELYPSAPASAARELIFSELPERPEMFESSPNANYAWFAGKYYTLNHPECVQKLCDDFAAEQTRQLREMYDGTDDELVRLERRAQAAEAERDELFGIVAEFSRLIDFDGQSGKYALRELENWPTATQELVKDARKAVKKFKELDRLRKEAK